ncbi:hypothetical protein Pmani_017790 [Petrolisthes manimaculis]|uniref:C2H2-type domain-containing protein n=1 Tax=Petrolisthes manimaculis TaxID=1843537 RepID=A0AAE1PLP5_9EUCA|nr:hypothetical protein Pmani_017790 [Petrolisthes manimaculis]
MSMNADEIDCSLEFNCGICGRSFSDPHSLKIHGAMHAPRNGRNIYECPDCGMTFRMELNFKYHLKKDTGLRTFGCGICSQKFTNPSCLETHYRVHSNEKSFICKQCGKTYIQLGSFKNHIMSHPATSACKECGKVFTNRNSLVAHEHAHVTQKPHACHSCGKRFAHAFNLEVHLNSFCKSTRDSPEKSDNTHTPNGKTLTRAPNTPQKNQPVSSERQERDGQDRVEVIYLESDEEGEEKGERGFHEDFLPLEVCLNEGEEELSLRDLMQRYDNE